MPKGIFYKTPVAWTDSGRTLSRVCHKGWLVVACMLITLLRHADRIKVACMAQLVNVIAPIMTENGGSAWMQTIFYPYMYASLKGRGETLVSKVECDTYKTTKGDSIPYPYTSAVDSKEGELTVFAVNRSLESDMELTLSLEGYEDYKLVDHTEVYHDDIKVENDKDNQRVYPVSREISDTPSVILKKHSWNMLRYKIDN